VLPFDGTDRKTAESYRILRTNLLHLAAQPKVIAISSAGPGDGKTTTAINISGALALKRESRVLLIDCDLRHGSVAPALGIEPSPGLAEALTGLCPLEDAIAQTDVLPNLFVLPAGRPMANPAELLDSGAFREMVSELREKFHFSVVDTTPIDIVADYALVQEVCDGTILVVRSDHTDRRTCMNAFQSVAKGKLLGTVLNCAQDWFLWRTRDYYGYYGRAAGEE
jgi:capsular exopolysaccharide synthesis family protein